MKKFLNKIFHPSKTKWFWLYFVIGIIGIVVAIFLMPIWNSLNVPWKSWGTEFINIIIFVCVLSYLFLFLFKRIRKRNNSVIQILTIIEFVLFSLIALGCILIQFRVLPFGEASQIIGLALWCRGTIEIFRAYYHQRESQDKYPLWWLVISIILVTLGTYMFLMKPISNLHILWVAIILLLLVSIILIADGFLAKPASTKEKKKKTKEEPKKEKDNE